MKQAAENLDFNKEYSVKDAISLLKKSSVALKFDPSVELSIKIGLDF